MKNVLTELHYGLAGRIYSSPLPFSPLFDPQGDVLDAYHKLGVDTIVMLTLKEEAHRLTGVDILARYQELGFDVIYSPVQDFSIPERGAFQLPLHKALQAAKSGQTIAIHCHAGIGRTGIFASCLAKVVFDMSGDEAVSWVRQYIPHAVENTSQYQYVLDFEYLLD